MISDTSSENGPGEQDSLRLEIALKNSLAAPSSSYLQLPGRSGSLLKREDMMKAYRKRAPSDRGGLLLTQSSAKKKLHDSCRTPNGGNNSESNLWNGLDKQNASEANLWKGMDKPHLQK